MCVRARDCGGLGWSKEVAPPVDVPLTRFLAVIEYQFSSFFVGVMVTAREYASEFQVSSSVY